MPVAGRGRSAAGRCARSKCRCCMTSGLKKPAAPAGLPRAPVPVNRRSVGTRSELCGDQERTRGHAPRECAG
jgi:hypothetical protein